MTVLSNTLTKDPKRGFYIFSRAHEVHYLTSIKMFKIDLCWVWVPICIGRNALIKNFLLNNQVVPHPHNFLPQILAETGLMVLFFIY